MIIIGAAFTTMTLLVYPSVTGKCATGPAPASIDNTNTDAASHVGSQGGSRSAGRDGRNDGAPMAHCAVPGQEFTQ